MKSIPKLIKRFIGIMLLSTFLLLILNLAVLYYIGMNQTASISPYSTANEVANGLEKSDSEYALDNNIQDQLNKNNIWAIFIDNSTHKVVWNTDNLPNNIPKEYSLSDISDLTLGYLKDYPTYVGTDNEGIIVLGYPKDRYWKLMWPSWDYSFIENLPQTILTVFICNILLIFIIYLTITGRLIKSVNPIIDGIKSLTSDNPISVKEKGVLSELAKNINQTSDILYLQEQQLHKKETARANWIAGISHDIRTPLSMVMGYAAQLESGSSLSIDERKKASIILKQSEKMRNLINDLNLASKLEYNMQPLNLQSQNIVAIIRQIVVDYLNTDTDNKYPIEWKNDDKLSHLIVQVDSDLIKRAINNLINNSIIHNENGCSIYVSVDIDDSHCIITVEDDGIGASDKQIENLYTAPHYMVCDDNTNEQQHGLGLLIVKQIAASHNGDTVIEHSKYGGLAVKIILPK